MNTSLRSLALIAGTVVASFSHAQAWRSIKVEQPTESQANPVLRWVRDFSPFTVEYTDLEQTLRDAPMEILGLPDQGGVELVLPTPDGRFQRFKVWQNDIRSKAVMDMVPDLKLYAGQGIDGPSAILRAEMGNGKFTAMVLGETHSFFIEPMKRKPDNTYFIYSRKDSMRVPGWTCHVDCSHLPGGQIPPFLDQPVTTSSNSRITGTNLYTFRLSMAATAEYVAFHGGTAQAVSAIQTSINRVDGVYRREASIRLNLITPPLVYTNAATDPFTNNNGVAMLTENQNLMNVTPGPANYDVGHVFSTGGGGVAGLGVVGIDSQKARGVTGSGSPVGDSFDIDYVAHEIGHQFGGNHSFNGTTASCGGGNRSWSTSWEPGSATTIMGYAGICGAEDVQSNSDAWFHIGSIAEMVAVRNLPGSDGVQTPSGNLVPVVNAGPDYTIPVSTPFRLTMSATDGNSDPMTFNWEPFDRAATSSTIHGGSTALTTTNTSRALFRTFPPSSTGQTRFFPSQALTLANNFTSQFEFLPNVARTMTMRAVARDNRSTGGGTNFDTMVITVSGTSSFALTAPASTVNWNRNSLQTVTWNVAGTNAAPFNTANVNIYLSTNGGASYFTGTATPLVLNTPNDGSQAVALGLTTAATSAARIIVEAAGNIYFSAGPGNFTVSTTNTAPSLAVISNQTINEESAWSISPVGSDPDTAQSLAYSFVGSPPAGMTINSTTGQINWTPSEAQGPGSYSVTVQVADNNSPTPATAQRAFTINVNEVSKVISGTVGLQYFLPAITGQTVTIQLSTSPTGIPVAATQTVNLLSTGAFSFFTQVPTGNYYLFASRSTYLRRRLGPVTVTPTGAAFGFALLRAGDLDNSGEVDAADIDLAILNFGGSNPAFDVDESGEIDAADIDFIIANFGQSND